MHIEYSRHKESTTWSGPVNRTCLAEDVTSVMAVLVGGLQSQFTDLCFQRPLATTEPAASIMSPMCYRRRGVRMLPASQKLNQEAQISVYRSTEMVFQADDTTAVCPASSHTYPIGGSQLRKLPVSSITAT